MTAADRFIRQRTLPEVGDAGQARLAAATVLVVGAGGLGCPVLTGLAGAGVGRIRLVDPDTVDLTNLHRQPLYRMADIGRAKAEAARDALAAYAPDTRVEAHVTRLDPGNVAALVAAADLVVDAADSFAATYILSDACHAAGKALVSASVLGLSGYAGAFCGGAPSYRAVFPRMPRQVATCATAGVLGPVVTMIGGLQAQMALALILGLSPSPLGRLVRMEAGRLGFGSFDFSGAPEPERVVPFIAPETVTADDLAIDLRGLDEAPVSPLSGARRMSVAEVEAAPPVAPGRRVVLACRSGVRAARAAEALEQAGQQELALVAFG